MGSTDATQEMQFLGAIKKLASGDGRIQLLAHDKDLSSIQHCTYHTPHRCSVDMYVYIYIYICIYIYTYMYIHIHVSDIRVYHSLSCWNFSISSPPSHSGLLFSLFIPPTPCTPFRASVFSLSNPHLASFPKPQLAARGSCALFVCARALSHSTHIHTYIYM